MANPTLQGDQYPKGPTKEEIQEIVREEQVNFIKALKTEIQHTPEAGDGNLRQREFLHTLEIVEAKLLV